VELGRLRIKASVVAGQWIFKAFAERGREGEIPVVGRIGRLGPPGDQNRAKMFDGMYLCKMLDL
jgi:hypothetical protein